MTYPFSQSPIALRSNNLRSWPAWLVGALCWMSAVVMAAGSSPHGAHLSGLNRSNELMNELAVPPLEIVGYGALRTNFQSSVHAALNGQISVPTDGMERCEGKGIRLANHAKPIDVVSEQPNKPNVDAIQSNSFKGFAKRERLSAELLVPNGTCAEKTFDTYVLKEKTATLSGSMLVTGDETLMAKERAVVETVQWSRVGANGEVLQSTWATHESSGDDVHTYMDLMMDPVSGTTVTLSSSSANPSLVETQVMDTVDGNRARVKRYLGEDLHSVVRMRDNRLHGLQESFASNASSGIASAHVCYVEGRRTEHHPTCETF